VGRVPLLADTGTRIALDVNSNRFILGSWSKGITCLELDTGKNVWHREHDGFTWANIVDYSRELVISGQKKDANASQVLDLERGDVIRRLHPCNNFLAAGEIKLGMNALDDVLLIYDKNWNLLGTPEWKSWGLRSFASDDDGVLIVSGPSGYIASFIPGQSAPVAELGEGERFGTADLIFWSKVSSRFYAVVSEFQGSEGRTLINLDHHLKKFEVVRRFPRYTQDVICENRYLVTEQGVVLDLDEQRELSVIDWQTLLA
jgi:hypothetical protein